MVYNLKLSSATDAPFPDRKKADVMHPAMKFVYGDSPYDQFSLGPGKLRVIAKHIPEIKAYLKAHPLPKKKVAKKE